MQHAPIDGVNALVQESLAVFDALVTEGNLKVLCHEGADVLSVLGGVGALGGRRVVVGQDGDTGRYDDLARAAKEVGGRIGDAPGWVEVAVREADEDGEDGCPAGEGAPLEAEKAFTRLRRGLGGDEHGREALVAGSLGQHAGGAPRPT